MNIDSKKNGYAVKKYDFPTKKYCQTLNLRNNPELLEKYLYTHSREGHWPVILEGIRSVGVLEMEIFLFQNRLFMIVETALDFEWDTAFAKIATLPKQTEWEDYMSVFQDAEPGQSSAEKWQLMDKIFHLYE